MRCKSAMLTRRKSTAPFWLMCTLAISLCGTVQGELNVYEPNWTFAIEAGSYAGIQGYRHYGIQGYQSTTYLVWGSHSILIRHSAYQIVGLAAILICSCACMAAYSSGLKRGAERRECRT